MGESSHPSPRRYPPELKERAVRLVLEAASEGERHGAVTRIAHQLGIGPESVRQWVRQAEIDQGLRARASSPDPIGLDRESGTRRSTLSLIAAVRIRS